MQALCSPQFIFSLPKHPSSFNSTSQAVLASPCLLWTALGHTHIPAALPAAPLQSGQYIKWSSQPQPKPQRPPSCFPPTRSAPLPGGDVPPWQGPSTPAPASRDQECRGPVRLGSVGPSGAAPESPHPGCPSFFLHVRLFPLFLPNTRVWPWF